MKEKYTYQFSNNGFIRIITLMINIYSMTNRLEHLYRYIFEIRDTAVTKKYRNQAQYIAYKDNILLNMNERKK